MSKGLINQLNNGKESTYSPLTYESLKGVIEDIFFKNTKPVKSSNIVMYTGVMGYYIYQLTFAGVNTPQCYFTIDTFNKSRLIVLNLGIKFGLYKAVINLRNADARVQIRQGTVVIKEGMSFDNLVEFLSKLPTDRRTFITKKGVERNYK